MPAIDMLLVRGNHDKRAGDPGPEIDIRCVDGAGRRAAIRVHAQAGRVGRRLRRSAATCIPAARLTGPGREIERLPCFWVGARTMVLPAFGEFTGVAPTSTAEPGDRVWVIAADIVMRVKCDRNH